VKCYINKIIVFLDIINLPVFNLEHITFRRLDSVSLFRCNLQLHASAALSSEKQTPHALGKELGRSKNRYAGYREEKIPFLYRESNPVQQIIIYI
jgi:hypothetical protein